MKVADFDRVVCMAVDTRWPAGPLRVRREVEARGNECSIFLNGSSRVAELGGHRYDRINGDVPAGFAGQPGAYHLAVAVLEVVRRADRDGVETLLIVEDDLEFTPDYDRVTDAIRVPDDWAMFYFGANHEWHDTDEAGPHLLRLHGSYTTHCAGVRRRAFGTILGMELTDPIDVLMRQVHDAFPCYAAWPSVAIQSPGPSIIHQGRHADYRGWFRSKGRNWPAEPIPSGPLPAMPPAGDVAAALARVAACPDRGGVLPVSMQREGCGCGELSECRAGKGKVAGRVSLRDCLVCRSS